MRFQIDTFEEEKRALEETLFNNANGYLGIRGNSEEIDSKTVGSIRGAYINGVYDIKDLKYSEKLFGFPETEQTLVNLIDAQGISTYINGTKLYIKEDNCITYSHYLDMQKGISKREIQLMDEDGHIFKLEICRMTSFKMLALFTIEYKIKSVNYAGKIRIESTMKSDVTNYYNPTDPRVAQESDTYLYEKEIGISNGNSYMFCETGRSEIKVGCGSFCETKIPQTFLETKHCLTTIMEQDIKIGEELSLIKYVTYQDERRQIDPFKSTMLCLEEAKEKGVSYYYKQQEMYLTKEWSEIGLQIKGNSFFEECLYYSLYQLMQGTGLDGISGVAAKALSGEGYEGHYFWDMEIYIFPVFLSVFPNKAKQLLHFRYYMLEQARAHAKEMGHEKGVLFAWRTITGGECSSYYPSGSAQYHINGDIAYAFMQYYLATNDIEYMVEEGAELLIETARLWMDVGHFINDTYRIDCVTGPDEYTCIINNNYYTNTVAKRNLEDAVIICKKLREIGSFEEVREKTKISLEEEAGFTKAAKYMYLPFDLQNKMAAQDDTFLQKKEWDIKSIPNENFPLLLHYHPLYIYRHKICKQADTVLAQLLFDIEPDEEVMNHTFDYYEAITTHDSSLSACAYGTQAARLKKAEKALYYFKKNLTLDISDSHHNSDMGIHTANMGGSYLMLLRGFAGVKMSLEGLEIAPIALKETESYSFRIKYQGKTIQLEVGQEDFTVTVYEDELPIKIYESVHLLKGENRFRLMDGKKMR